MQQYYEIRNILSLLISIDKRFASLEHILEAYPESFTLKEVKDQLLYQKEKFEFQLEALCQDKKK